MRLWGLGVPGWEYAAVVVCRYACAGSCVGMSVGVYGYFSESGCICASYVSETGG